MTDLRFILQQKYETSRALVIGINKYKNSPPLEYAVNDAKEIRDVLIEELGFEDENITYLVDEEASRANILKQFLRFSCSDVKVDDRLFVFFAGHGHTRTGFKSEVGFLVPYDADMDDASTFIRWDEFTRNAELIRAKHILFVMDACYGGLAVQRDSSVGSSRFLKDMYQRRSRQVITAGKANETVADSGGPLPNHSVFTGYFIQGIRGDAANEHGVITANSLMSYVYTKVSSDINSEQTPHYGQFDGDGDFIISTPAGEDTDNTKTIGEDELFTIPYVDTNRHAKTTGDKIDYVKELLSLDNSQIKLHDFAVEEVQFFLSSTSEDSFATSGHYSKEELVLRISSYEEHSKDLLMIISCLSHWAKENHLTSLSKVVSRSCDRLLESNGLVKWVNLRWYPLLLFVYSAGIAAIESKNYKSLAAVFYTKLGSSHYDESEAVFVQKVGSAAGNLSEVFKDIPGHERNYTPMSEYLYKLLQPELDKLFFLGKGYEAIFDEFEVLFALVLADFKKQAGSHVWGPIGRFGWKNRRSDNSPFKKLRYEAAQYQEKWGPIEAGMFGGDYNRFEEIAEHYQKEILDNLNWF